MAISNFDVFLSCHCDHAQVLTQRLREKDLTVFLDRCHYHRSHLELSLTATAVVPPATQDGGWIIAQNYTPAVP